MNLRAKLNLPTGPAGQAGISLLQLIAAMAVMAIIVTLARGRGQFAGLVPGAPANAMIGMVADRNAPQLCQAFYDETGTRLEKCVNFGKQTCAQVAREALVSCMNMESNGISSDLSDEEILSVMGPCVTKTWVKLLASKPRIGKSLRACKAVDAYFAPRKSKKDRKKPGR